MEHDLVFASMSSDIVTLTYQVQRLMGDSHESARSCALAAARRHMEALRPGVETQAGLDALGMTLDNLSVVLRFPTR
jgi:hypothetical protein